MEGRITCEHMDIIWAAAQLKHCAKPVHDLLPGLVKHLSASPALHLYSLLVKLEPKDHTEQVGKESFEYHAGIHVFFCFRRYSWHLLLLNLFGPEVVLVQKLVLLV